ncbi:hypothetical protein [Nocardia sp. NPDC057455]|uniref:hypothetical protein n=1 Tax=Nocardia sp. NPDC057455 TaxID=3346138 RepID=UPI00366FFA77
MSARDELTEAALAAGWSARFKRGATVFFRAGLVVAADWTDGGDAEAGFLTSRLGGRVETVVAAAPVVDTLRRWLAGQFDLAELDSFRAEIDVIARELEATPSVGAGGYMPDQYAARERRAIGARLRRALDQAPTLATREDPIHELDFALREVVDPAVACISARLESVRVLAEGFANYPCEHDTLGVVNVGRVFLYLADPDRYPRHVLDAPARPVSIDSVRKSLELAESGLIDHAELIAQLRTLVGEE